jgi:hypothetical protein
MTYRADDGSAEERVWNSRDGVTPFVITLRGGQTATHVDWGSDERMPEDWVPPPGMRVFADLTAERARELAAVNYDRWLADPERAGDLLRVFGGDRDAAVAQLAASYLSQPGVPTLIDQADSGG